MNGDQALLREDGEDADEMRRRIRHYDHLYAQNQQQGKPLEALEFLERGLFLRKELLGADSPETSKVACVFTSSLCTMAMNALQRDNFMQAYEMLKKAEILTSPGGYIADKKTRMKLRAVTFNNFGCFYKRRGKLHAALQYLAKALKIELSSQEVDNPAGTHLNLCATLSQLKRHGPALEHAQCALQLLQAAPDTRGKNEGASILAIAWHNLAVEQEHLNMMDAAIASYRQAVLVAEKEWGANHMKTLAIKHSYEEALVKAKARLQNRREPGITSTHHSGTTGLLEGLINPRRSPSQKKGKKQRHASPPQSSHSWADADVTGQQHGLNSSINNYGRAGGGGGGGSGRAGMGSGGVGGSGGGVLPALNQRGNSSGGNTDYRNNSNQPPEIQQLPPLSTGSPRRGPQTPTPADDTSRTQQHARPGRRNMNKVGGVQERGPRSPSASP